MELHENLSYLDKIVASDLSVFFVENSTLKVEQIGQLCQDVGEVVDVFVESSTTVDMTDSHSLGFLKHTLPVIIEILLRRKSARENEKDIANLLVKVSKLLAQPGSLDIFELCELRNMLLVGSYSGEMKFINHKQLVHPQRVVAVSSVNSGFYGDYGRANTALVGRKPVFFWSDEWFPVLGRFKAVGHYVEVLVPHGGHSKPSWTGGQIIHYNAEKNLYSIEIDHAVCSSELGLSDLDDLTVLKINLETTPHIWVDMENRDRANENDKQKKTGVLHLSYSGEDANRYVRVWWSKYEKYFYGKIVEWDSEKQQHAIHYEDGDVRVYDMTTKVYDVLYPPSELLSAVAESGVTEVCKAISSWHQKLLSDGSGSPTAAASSNTIITATVDAVSNSTSASGNGSGGMVMVSRPTAGTSITISEHQRNCINTFFREGGSESLFASLSDTMQPSPSCKMILSHVQLIYGLHNLIATGALKELAWELKECVSFALLKFQDSQMKDFQLKEFNDICIGLKDILQAVIANDGGVRKEAKLQEFFDSLELFRMAISSKLLNGVQLQKRFLGLSMIRDVVDAVYPRVIAFAARRSQLITLQASKSGGKQPAVQQQYQHNAGSVANPQFSLFKTSLTPVKFDAWLLENQVLEAIFGESFHQDLAAKSEVVLCYMAHRKLMTERHIDWMWQCCSRGAHEAVVRVLHYLFVLMVPVLDPSLRSYLFSLISAVPFKEYTEQLIVLIKTFTIHSLQAMKDEAAKQQATSNSPNTKKNDGLSPTTPTGSGVGGGNNGGGTAGGGSTAAVRGSTNLRKGLVVSAPQRQWMGFGVLWHFVQDPQTESAANAHIIDESLNDLAIVYLVELLQEEFRDERDIVMQKCLDNVQHGISVAVSLQILRKVLTLYPSDNKKWFGLGRPTIVGAKTVTIGSQIDKLIKQNHLLEIVFEDLEKYRRSIASSELQQHQQQSYNSSGTLDAMDGGTPTATGSVADSAVKKVRMVTKGGRVSHIKSVVERLDFLKFIVSKSTLKLSESQAMILWRTFGEDAVTSETLDKLCIWLDGLICRESKQLSMLLLCLVNETDPIDNSPQSPLALLIPHSTSSAAAAGGASSNEDGDASVFDEGVIVRLFEECILKWAYRNDKVDVLSRPPVANLCFKIFLLVNIINRSIRVEADAPWYRAGQLFGMSLLWRIAVDTSNKSVALAAIALIVELQHRTPNRFKASENIKGSFLRQCFKQLYYSIQSLQEGEAETSSGPSTPSRRPQQSQQQSDEVPAAAAAGSSTAVPGTPPRVVKKPSQMSLQQQALHNQAQQNHNHSATVKAQLDDWFDDGKAIVTASVISTRISRLIVTLRRFIRRFYVTPAQLCTVKILSGRDESPVLSLMLKSTDTVGTLRTEILKHFKEQSENVMMVRVTKNTGLLSGGPDKLEQVDMTLGQMKFSYVESVQVSRIAENSGMNGGNGASKSVKQPTTGAGNASAAAAPTVKDLFTPADLNSDSLDASKGMLTWLGAPEDSPVREVFQMPRPNSRSHIDLQKISESLDKEAAKTLPSESTETMEKVVEYLTPLVKNSPHYIDQLLEMLDGYLSTEIQNAVGSDFDLSNAVWDILQSLPTHSVLYQQVRDISDTASGSGASVNSPLLSHLLDPMNSYRLLYTLQIVESFLDSEGSTSKAAAALLQQTPGTFDGKAFGVVDWATKFFLMGGVDVIVTLLQTEVTKLQQSARNSAGTPASLSICQVETVVSSQAKRDRSFVIVAVLCRILHRLLLFDSAYRQWQGFPSLEDTPEFLMCLNSKIPPGAVMSCVDARSICHSLLSVSLVAAQSWDLEGTCSAFKALAENSTMLVFALLAASDECLSIIQSFPQVSDWIRSLCSELPDVDVRSKVCLRIFSGCANLYRTVSSSVVFNQEMLKLRAEVFRLVHREVFACIQTCNSSSDSSVSGIVVVAQEQLLSLMASLEALHSAPNMVFSEIKPSELWAATVGAITGVNAGAEDWHVLAQFFVEKFVQYRSTETFHSAQSDGNLLGYLRILIVLSNGSDELRKFLGNVKVYLEENHSIDLITYVYVNGLFPAPSVNSSAVESMVSTCQTKTSRQLAYALLSKLCDSDMNNLTKLVTVMSQLQKPATGAAIGISAAEFARKYIVRWDYDPNTLLKDYGSYIGLTNQGGTCYMNSFLQQLFHISAFTESLLRIHTTAVGKDQKLNEQENLLFQLQVMFGYMKLSQKRYYDTLPFCRAFIDYDGQPVNLSEQKDINEFAGMLFEKLEHNKMCASLLASTIQGKIVYKTKSTESSYISEREEPFYMITAEVKDKSTLEDSLELNSAEELFSGDNKIEDSEGRKVDALRRCAIRALPPTLIIHLKRFEFDIETMNRKKVNDLLTFPMSLNMFPYTEEGIEAREARSGLGGADDNTAPSSDDSAAQKIKPESYYQYELKGVVAHVGAIDRGHYYSFIRDTNKSTNNSANTNRWQEFNDRSVLPFSVEAIPKECFGGLDEASGRVRENNAYLLFYERVGSATATATATAGSAANVGALSAAEESGKEESSAIESLSSSGHSAASAEGAASATALVAVDKSRPMARKVTEAIWSENISFQRDRFLFDNIHLKFIWQLLQLKAIDKMLEDKTPLVEASDVLFNSAAAAHSQLCDLRTHSRTLANLVMVGLRICLEVLVRARAHEVIHLYFERLEEIVMLDTSRLCAITVLEEIIKETPIVPDVRSGSIETIPKSKYQVEREQVESCCHPWLLQMFVYCPHANSTRAFARFLMTCVKMLRASQCEGYEKTTADSTSTSVVVAGSSGEHTPRLVSCVSRFFDKLLLLTEKLLVEDVGRSDGYKLASMMMFQFASLGEEERHLLMYLKTVYRMVCSMLTVNPSANNVPDTHMRYSIELVTLLVKSSLKPAENVTSSASEGTTVAVATTPKAGSGGGLRKDDLQAFMNRVFLEDAIAFCTVEMSQALQQICIAYGIKEGMRILEFLSDKVCEFTTVSNGTLLNYRPYFRILTEILIGPGGLPHIIEYSSIVTKLMSKAYSLSTRHGQNDAELVYAVCKLNHRLGTASAQGHQVVMKAREYWRDISLKYVNAKKGSSSGSSGSGSGGGNVGNAPKTIHNTPSHMA